MKAKEIVDDLQYGELSAHGMFFDVLTDKNKAKLISSINMGLTALYSRFPLLTKELTIIQKAWLTQYRISSEFAKTNPDAKIVYILDTPNDPYRDDLIRIEAVYNEIGESLMLNNTTECKVALTPSMDILEVPNPVEGDALFVIYKANHPKVLDMDTPILLPSHLVPALLAYSASRVYSGSSSQDQAQLAVSLMQKYEMLCNQSLEFGITNSEEGEYALQFCKGGWI